MGRHAAAADPQPRECGVRDRASRGGRAALRLHRQGYQPEAAIRSELWWCAALGRARASACPPPCPRWTARCWSPCPTGRAASRDRLDRGRAAGRGRRALCHARCRSCWTVTTRLGGWSRELHDATDGLTLPDGFPAPALGSGRAGRRDPVLGPVLGPPRGHRRPARARLLRARDALRERLCGLPELRLIHADVLRENVFVNDHSVCPDRLRRQRLRLSRSTTSAPRCRRTCMSPPTTISAMR